jgi:3-oxoacyl-[acyl-carrier protein] reductase
VGSERSRVALVTGAGSGIGRAIAEKLAKDGESVVVNDLEEEDAKKAAARIEEEGGRTTAAPGDVSEPEDVRKIVEAARETYGPVEVLVSNAGFLQQQPFVDHTVEDFDRRLSAGRGVVVNIASQLGQIGAEGLAHYAAANAGIIGLTKSLAREVSAQGVRVNAVAPGPVNTPLVTDNLPEEWHEAKATELPLGRFGEPYEVAETVSFLASNAAALYVGQTLGPNSGDVML